MVPRQRAGQLSATASGRSSELPHSAEFAPFPTLPGLGRMSVQVDQKQGSFVGLIALNDEVND
jgi:hypothetical protein